ncbi:MAG: FAD-linked oxidase C-terminal domain-containing protein, partial [Thermoprotei archaeon]
TVAYDELDESMKTSVKNWYNEIMKAAISIGGSMSSEHGIGLRKKEGLIAELEHSNSLKALEIMKSIKKIFDPKGLLNPGKVFDIEI